MGSRVYTVGNVVARAKELLKSGVLKTRPVWLDAIEEYPPLTPMAVNAGCVPGRPPRVNYRKDLLMKDFYERYRKPEETISLFEDHSQQTIAEKFVEYQLALIGDQWITKELKHSTSLEAKDYMKSHYGLQLLTKTENLPKYEPVFEDEFVLPVDQKMDDILNEVLTNDDHIREEDIVMEKVLKRNESDKELSAVLKERVLTNKKSKTLHDLLRSFSNEL